MEVPQDIPKDERQQRLDELFDGKTSVMAYGRNGIEDAFSVNGHLVTRSGDYSGIDSDRGENHESIKLSREDASGILAELAFKNIFGN